MTSKISTSLRFTSLCVVLVMVACGGGGGGDAAVAPTTPADPSTPVVLPDPVTPAPASSDRIEPLDLGLPKLANAAASVVSPRSAVLSPSSVRLDALTAAQTQAAPKATTTPLARAGAAAVPPQIGVSRSVRATASVSATLAQLQWRQVGGGLQRAAISFTADGALGVRVGVLVRSLPAGTTLRFYAQAGGAPVQVSGDEVLRTVQRNLDAGDTGDGARTYWSPDFGGAETTLEVELPVGANLAELNIAIPTISHFVVSPDAVDAQTLTKVGEAGTCNIDVSCKPELSSESRSVARMIFVRDGNSYLCTGTVLNDSQSSTTPYFLSANHCISSQSVASSLTTDWFYRSTSCNSGSLNPATQRLVGGASLLYADAATDTSFMRLNRAAPQGVVYAGSYFGDVSQTASVIGIHHPAGDLQKTSAGAVAQFSNCSNEQCQTSNAQDGRFFSVGWTQGTTEGGSSGSGLFFAIGSSRYVVGQLYGGTSSCLAPAGRDYYGRFDVAFRSSLKQWLKPGA